MKEILVVEYEPGYAARLAEMWNKSSEGWEGESIVYTEASVAEEMASAANLKSWLALAGDEVVGFCSFSEYRDDEGASYIPLLNVRPDYHGRKIGKRLVLKAVAEACKHPWPRLDLYTWAGNTKAVPLYKKCGFFWEDRDDSTHFMNFIPYIMQTEAVAEYFSQGDWYGDSVREIMVVPDGRKENGFDYYEYRWQHGQSILRAEFERRGRGLRLLETDDWLIEATVEAHQLVFGSDYSIHYHLVNKTGNGMQVSLRGRDDKNVKFAYENDVAVEGSVELVASFHVGEISEEQNTWLTHPAVVTEIAINRKKALFKVGIVPKYPLLLRALAPAKVYAPGTEGEFYLNLENGYGEPAHFSFSLPVNGSLKLAKGDFAVDLAPKEKRAISVGYILNKPGVFSGEIEIVARPETGQSVHFNQDLMAVFPGGGRRFGGEAHDHYFGVNGQYMFLMDKYTNTVEVRGLVADYSDTYFLQPELGKPYSVEFTKTKAAEVHWTAEEEAFVMRAVYNSSSMPGIVIERLMKLWPDGIFSQEWQLCNTGIEPVPGLWFKASVDANCQWPVLPLNGRIYESQDSDDYLSAYNLHNLSENWLFFKESRRGLCWPQGMKIMGNDWFWLEIQVGELAPGEIKRIEPIYLAMDTFSDWRAFRRFAGQSGETEYLPRGALEVSIGDGNPFVTGPYQVKIQQHQLRNFKGQITIGSGELPDRETAFEGEKAGLKMPGMEPGQIDLLDVAVSTSSVDYQRQIAVFGYGGFFREKKEEASGFELLSVDNGYVSYAIAPEFGPVMYSLKFQGKEWLDSSFPVPGPKSWWNPWLGGFGFEVRFLSMKSLLTQPRTVEFVSAKDSFGNLWRGLQAEVAVSDHDRYQGLSLRQSYLTLPGLAGLCVLLEIEQGGVALNSVSCGSVGYYKPGQSSGQVEYLSPHGDRVRLKQDEENEIPQVNQIIVRPEAEGQILTISYGANISGYINKEVMQVGNWQKRNLLPGKRITALPLFLFFGQERLPQKAIESLAGLSWYKNK